MVTGPVLNENEKGNHFGGARAFLIPALMHNGLLLVSQLFSSGQ
jgi:hypothetical protein